MNGAHDLGGMHGFGPVVPEPNEPVFHAEWEERVFALRLAMSAWRRWNLDMERAERETMPPAEYLASTYFEHWLHGLERLLVQKGFLAPEELARLRQAPETIAVPQPPIEVQTGALRREQVEPMLRDPHGARRDASVAPRFMVGERVVARNIHPVGHTRLPRYVRGRRGRVEADYGVFVFPDTRAAEQGSNPQHVYSVRFEARELWGPDAAPRDSVYVDLWDDYLEPA